MRLHAAGGDRAGALRVFQRCVETLQAELDVEPSPATRELHQRLLAADFPAPTPSPADPDQLPLIGRAAEWEKLRDVWFAASSGKPQCVVLVGEAGIGKTRLAEELIGWVESQGFVAPTAHCYAAEGTLAYAPVVSWLRSTAISQRLASLEPVWLGQVARLLPELLTQRPDLPHPGASADGSQRQNLFEATARALLGGNDPLLLFVDDLQWADQDTLEWLHYLLRFNGRARLLLLATVRAEDATANPASAGVCVRTGPGWTDQRTGNRPAHGVRKRGGGRSRDRGFAQPGRGRAAFPGRPKATPSLWWRLRAPVNGRGSVAGGERRFSSHILRLTPIRCRRVFTPSSTPVWPSFRPRPGKWPVWPGPSDGSSIWAVLTRASEQNDEALVASLDELWQRRIVRERGGDVYDFTHDKLREVAYTSLSAARRRLLHRRIAQALEAEHSHALDGVAGQVAVHYELGGLLAQAVPYYQRAGEAAERVYAHADAIQHFRRALALLAGVTGEAETSAVALYERQADILHWTGQYEEARASFQQALASVPGSD